MAAERSRTTAATSTTATLAPRHALVAMSPASPAMCPSYATGSVSVAGGVAARRWTNALAVDTKAFKAIGHGPRRLLERST
jgi:hypothetical protein